MGLAKATLQKLPSTTKGSPGAEIPVQFNPTSLRISLTNQTENGKALAQRPRQYLASGTAKLTMQLVFDTADEAEGNKPISVRRKTKLVTQFVDSELQGKKHAPPAVRFHWGDLVFDGIIDSVTEEIDLFADDGTPLRAKVDVTITGQNTKVLQLLAGPGASRDGSASNPGDPSTAGPGAGGPPSAAPSTASGPAPDRTATANAGESAAAFAARQGMDPAAWRAFADQIDDPLSLPAGQAINFAEATTLAPGLGAAAGFLAGATENVVDAIESARSAVAGVGAQRTEEARRAGFALSAAGGVGPAVEASQIDRAQNAVAASVRSFAAPAGGGEQASVAAAAASAGSRTGGASAARPVSDRRQNAYGFGVPLRARIAPAAHERAAVVFGARALMARVQSEDPPMTNDPTVAPWVELPRPRAWRSEVEGRLTPRTGGCGCRGRCGCQH